MCTPASAAERGGKAWTIEGEDGERYGCKYIGSVVSQILCTPLNGPGAMVEYYTVDPDGDGGWAVFPLNENEGTEQGAERLARVLNTAPAYAMPPSPAIGGAPAIRPPIAARAGALCIVNYTVPIDVNGTLTVEWGDGATTYHSVVAGQQLQLVHQFPSTGAGAEFSERVAGGTRYVHRVDYRHSDGQHVWLDSTFIDHIVSDSGGGGGDPCVDCTDH